MQGLAFAFALDEDPDIPFPQPLKDSLNSSCAHQQINSSSQVDTTPSLAVVHCPILWALNKDMKHLGLSTGDGRMPPVGFEPQIATLRAWWSRCFLLNLSLRVQSGSAVLGQSTSREVLLPWFLHSAIVDMLHVGGNIYVTGQ